MRWLNNHERICFWLNVFNMLHLHALIELSAPASLLAAQAASISANVAATSSTGGTAAPAPASAMSLPPARSLDLALYRDLVYDIDGQHYSLLDIEQRIMRSTQSKSKFLLPNTTVKDLGGPTFARTSPKRGELSASLADMMSDCGCADCRVCVR